MKLKFALPLLALTLTAAQAQTVSVYPATTPSNIEFGILGGYYNGFGGQIFLGMKNLSGPIGARLSASYASNDDVFDTTPAGFTNPKNKTTTVGLDATYDVGRIAAGTDLTVYGGVRYGNFKQTTTYAGSDVDFKSNAFGLGAGVEASYPISNNLSIIGNIGADYYFKSDIDATPNASGYSGTIDSDDSHYDNINRPSALLKAGIGVKYRF